MGNIKFYLLFFAVLVFIKISFGNINYEVEFPGHQLNIFRGPDNLLYAYVYDDALEQFEDILTNQPNLSEVQKTYATIRIAMLYRKLYDRDTAWIIINEAEHLVDKNLKEIDPIRALCYHEKGELCEYINKYSISKEYIQKAIDLRTELFGDSSFIRAISIIEMGELHYYSLFEDELAAYYFEEAFEIFNKTSKQDNHYLALAYYYMSITYWRRFEYDHAIEYAKRTLEIENNCQFPKLNFIPSVYNTLCRITSESKDYKLSIDYGQKALESVQKYDPNNISKLNFTIYNLAIAYNYDNQFLKSIELLKKAININKNIKKYDPINNEAFNNELARNYAQIGESEESKQILEVYIDSFLFYNEFCSNEYILFNLRISENYEILQSYDESYNYVSKAIDCFTNKLTANDFQYQQLGNLYYRKAHLQKEYLREDYSYEEITYNLLKADSLYKLHKINSKWNSSKLNTGIDNRNYYNETIDFLYQTNVKNGVDNINQIYKLIESNFSFLLYESLINNLLIKEKNISDDQKQYIKNIEKQLLQIQSLVKLNSTKESLLELENLRIKRDQFYQKLENTSLNRNENLFFENIPTLTELQLKLNEFESIIMFYQSSNYYYRLVINKTSTQIDKINIEEDVKEFNKLFTQFELHFFNSEEISYYDSLANQLYNKLLFDMPNETKKITVIKDGILNHLPFESLTYKKVEKPKSFSDLNYALNRFTVNYACSNAHLYNTNREGRKLSKLLSVIPDSVIATSEEEHKLLNGMFPKIYSSKNHLEKLEILNLMEEVDIIHFSTHGVLDTIQSMYNYLLINDSLKLFEHEIGSTKTSASLVFLNACESNIGENITGEGVFSLARSFLQAGCPSTIASLWKISQATSSGIAINFYDNVNNRSISEALTIAKRQYLQDNVNDLKSHPYYWAGLISIGNGAPLQFKKKRSYKVFLIPLLLILIVSVPLYKQFSRASDR